MYCRPRWWFVIFPGALRGSGRKDHTWLVEACLTNQVRREDPWASGSLNPQSWGAGKAVCAFQGSQHRGPAHRALSDLVGWWSGWQPLGPAASPWFEEGRVQRLSQPGERSGHEISDAALLLPDRVGWASFLRAAPQGSGSLPGKSLQTRVSWTAGVESISSQLFEGTLRGKYGKSWPLQAGRLTLGGVARPWGIWPALPLAQTQPPLRDARGPCSQQQYWRCRTPWVFLSPRAIEPGRTGQCHFRRGWRVPTAYSNVRAWEAKRGHPACPSTSLPNRAAMLGSLGFTPG